MTTRSNSLNRAYGSEFWPGKLIAVSLIELFWERAKEYHGQNFYVITWCGRNGKPHLKACREAQ